MLVVLSSHKKWAERERRIAVALRIRKINGKWVACCAAKTKPEPDDIYLDDGMFSAVMDKFAYDFNQMWGYNIPINGDKDIIAKFN